MSSKSSKTSSNKAQKGGDGGGGSAPTTPLVKALLKEKGIIRKVVEWTSVSQTLRLLMTCKELLAAEKDVFEKHKLPVVCNMKRGSNNWLGVVEEGNEFKLYRAIVGTPNSPWLKWLDTSEVEELILPTSGSIGAAVTATTPWSVPPPSHVMDEEMLIMFGAASSSSHGFNFEGEGRGKRFSKLRTLNVSGDLLNPSRITDTSVMEVARQCSNLQSLNLGYCENVTDASVMEVARRCSNLQTLDLNSCRNITDASVMEVARGCLNLKTFLAPGSITDASLLEVARRCSNLQTLNLFCCHNITDVSLLEVAKGCSNLQSLNLSNCQGNITDASVLEVARRCSNLQTLDLGFCMNITSACKNALRQSHPKLQTI